MRVFCPVWRLAVRRVNPQPLALASLRRGYSAHSLIWMGALWFGLASPESQTVSPAPLPI